MKPSERDAELRSDTHHSCLKNLWCAPQNGAQTRFPAHPVLSTAAFSERRNSFLQQQVVMEAATFVSV